MSEELRSRTQSVNKLYEQEGWAYLEAEWFLERERIIGLGKKAVEEGKTEAAAYSMAELAGFDKALKVPSRFRELFKEFVAEEIQKEKARDGQ